MNHISKTHKLFSESLNNPKVLENPEEFLGPNYKKILNFWLILDDLSQEQWKVVNERYWAFFNENGSEWDKVRDLAWEVSEKVDGEYYANEAGNAVWGVTMSDAAYWATIELIGMHLILDQQPLFFFPMFINS